MTQSRSASTAAISILLERRARTGTEDIEENLELFENMKNGMYKDGEKVLRAKIRHGVTEYQHERSGYLPRGSYDSPQHRRQVVHLSDVRFCSSD